MVEEGGLGRQREGETHSLYRSNCGKLANLVNEMALGCSGTGRGKLAADRVQCRVDERERMGQVAIMQADNGKLGRGVGEQVESSRVV